MGTAGTGKSYLIQGIRKYLKTSLLVTATTGVAAFHIQGITIHSLLGLPCQPFQERELSKEMLKRKQEQFQPDTVKYLIIDEISMCGQKMLYWIDYRLKEITGTKDKPFGGINMILVGDFAQLPPCADRKLYVQPHAEVNSGSFQLYREFKTVIYLQRIQRQTDEGFIDFLTAVRNGKVTKKHYDYIINRATSRLPQSELKKFENAVRIMPTNERCANYNYEKLKQLKQPIAEIAAIHSPNSAKNADAKKAGGLIPILYLCNGARVMLTSNQCAAKGLANGSFGTVQAILYEEGHQPPEIPKAVIVKFDEFTGNSILETIPKCVAITSITAEWPDKSGFSYSRQQIPLRLAWAITIHKSQGQTLSKVVIDFKKDETKKTHFREQGMEFVALSRVRKLEDLVMEPITYERFMKINSKNEKLIKEEKRLKDLAKETKNKYGFNNIINM